MFVLKSNKWKFFLFRNQPEIMEVLLRKGANIDVVNKGRCSALHVAVNKQHPSCVKLLLKYNCDVNVQVSLNWFIAKAK